MGVKMTMTTRAYLEVQEVELLEHEANNMRDKLLIRVMFRLGCRVSEALALEVKDINFIQGTVTIQHLKSRLKLGCRRCGASVGKSHSFCPECGAPIVKPSTREEEHRRIRTLPLDRETLDFLKDYIRRGGPVKRDDRLLIFGMNRHRAWQIVRDCADRAGLPKLVNPESGKLHGVSPHRLRDAFATHAVKLDDSGDGLRLLQEHLGHASFNTTAKYRKISGEEHRKWYGKLWRKGNP